MQRVNVDELEMLSVAELKAFRDQVDAAIRAAIARSRVDTNVKFGAPVKVDLERERDAWKASRFK